jgi:hypothetical protein
MVRAQLDERQWPDVAAILETQRGAGRRGKDDWKRLDDAVGHDQEVERQVVYVESFVIELHAL